LGSNEVFGAVGVSDLSHGSEVLDEEAPPLFTPEAGLISPNRLPLPDPVLPPNKLLLGGLAVDVDVDSFSTAVVALSPPKGFALGVVADASPAALVGFGVPNKLDVGAVVDSCPALLQLKRLLAGAGVLAECPSELVADALGVALVSFAPKDPANKLPVPVVAVFPPSDALALLAPNVNVLGVGVALFAAPRKLKPPELDVFPKPGALADALGVAMLEAGAADVPKPKFDDDCACVPGVCKAGVFVFVLELSKPGLEPRKALF
jgi:hypothetical protein